MNSMLLLTALTATSGLFGGGGCYRGYGQCGGMMAWGHAPRYACGSTYMASGCYRGYAAQCRTGYPAPAAAPVPAHTPAPSATPATTPSTTTPATPSATPPQTRVVPVAPRVAQAGYYYPSYYYSAAYYSAAPTCPNGNCYRR
jgi:hypothetical protein